MPALHDALRRAAPPLLLVALLAGCSEKVDPTGPAGTDPDPEPVPVLVAWDMSVDFSSINAIGDCENDPGNPGDFRTTLVVTHADEFGNRVTVGAIGPVAMTLYDGDVQGAVSEPLSFRMPNEPGASFQVEYTVGEYDPNADMEVHGYQVHTLDRDPDQLWRSGVRDYDSYSDKRPDESYGVLRFAVWNTRDGCQGYARYQVTWTPVYETPAN